jgi:hypothetical protein
MTQRTKHSAVRETNLSYALCGVMLWGVLQIFFTTACASEISLAKDVPFTTLFKGNHSGIRQKQFLVIRSHAEWDNLWRSHWSTTIPKQELPKVDFAAETVVALFSGERRTGGLGIEVTKVEEDPQTAQLKVFYREIEPPRNAIVTQALTQPFHIIKLRRNTDRPVVFLRSNG